MITQTPSPQANDSADIVSVINDYADIVSVINDYAADIVSVINDHVDIVPVLTAAISSRGSSLLLCESGRETRSTSFSC